MEFKKLKAMYEGGFMVTYKGKKYDVVGINTIKETAQICDPDGMFEPAIEVNAEELE